MNNQREMLFIITSGKEEPGKITLNLKMALEGKRKEMDISLLLMLDGTNLAKESYLSEINAGSPFRPALDKMKEFIMLGGKIYAAKSCFLQKNIGDEDLLDGVKVIKIDKILELMEKNSKIISL